MINSPLNKKNTLSPGARELKNPLLMRLSAKGTALFCLILAFLLAIFVYTTRFQTQKTKQALSTPKLSAQGQVKYPQDYTFLLVGDSMTQALGNCDELRRYLKEYYPSKSFEFLNYGFGSTNILSLQARLEQDTEFGRTFRPITQIDFDILLLESFGNNPLSQLPLEEGLKKQTDALDSAMETLKRTNPRAKVIFVATIAPNKAKYGQGVVDLTSEQRVKWVDERIAYVQNHLEFAKSRNIPYINIFEKSLKDGDGNLEYLLETDYIHPSPSGVYFISRQIADFIHENRILN